VPWTLRTYRTCSSCLSCWSVERNTCSLFPLTTTLGFLGKVKKILESICVNCGKLKADTVSIPITLLAHFLGALPTLRVRNPEPAVLRMISAVARPPRVFVPSRGPHKSSAVGVRLRGEKESWVMLEAIGVAYRFSQRTDICLLYRSVSHIMRVLSRKLRTAHQMSFSWRSRISTGSLTSNFPICSNGFSPILHLPVELNRHAIIPKPAWQLFGASVKAR
jgi:hypothetical protein